MNWLKQLLNRNPCNVEPEIDEHEWNAAWSNRPMRKVSLPLAFDPLKDSNFGEVIEAGISLIPETFIWRMYFPAGETCPLCGDPTNKTVAIAADFDLTYKNLLLGCPAWVHHECFEKCEETGETAKIPW